MDPFYIRVESMQSCDSNPLASQQQGRTACERKRKQRENAEFRKREQLADTTAKRAKRSLTGAPVNEDVDSLCTKKKKRPNRRPGMTASERMKKMRGNVKYRAKEKLADRAAKSEKRKLPGVLVAQAAARRHRIIVTSDTMRKQKKNCEVKNHRRRKKLPLLDLAIEDLMKCTNVTPKGRYPVNKQRIAERLNFVISKVVIFADAEALVRMGLLEALVAVLRRLGSERSILMSVLDVLDGFLVCYKEWSETVKDRAIDVGVLPLIYEAVRASGSTDLSVTGKCAGVVGLLIKGSNVRIKAVFDICDMIGDIIASGAGDDRLTAECVGIFAYISRVTGEFNRAYCTQALRILRSLPNNEWREKVTHRTMQWVAILIDNPQNKQFLVNSGIERILLPFDNYNCGVERDSRYSLMTSVASSIMNRIKR
jgi:hypothetical protein